MKNFKLEQLTEGIQQRNVGKQFRRLTEKWNRTGLLRGLNGQNKENMAVLLENQAAQVLRESNALGSNNGGGNVQGFQNIAFPIVRRVFGELAANELVSVQPMSLPSGLLFYLDYTYGTSQGGINAGDSIYTAGDSIYSSPSGASIREGSLETGGQYDLLGSGYSRVHSSVADATGMVFGSFSVAGAFTDDTIVAAGTVLADTVGRLMQYDQGIETHVTNGSTTAMFALIPTAIIPTADLTMVKDIAIVPRTGEAIVNMGTAIIAPSTLGFQAGTNVTNIRRLNQRVDFDSAATPAVTSNPVSGDHILTVILGSGGTLASDLTTVSVSFVLDDALTVDGTHGGAFVVPAFEANLASGETINNVSDPIIPEIDIKIESISVTATSRRLKARWTPELAQDLQAYHSLDPEVELTQILSEQIAVEIDAEILTDLLTQANGANLFWSRAPGKYVNKLTGAAALKANTLSSGPSFAGTARDWYETLIETIIDASNTIQRKTLRGSANFIVVGPDVATILESTNLYSAAYALDGSSQVGGMTIGTQKIGSLSNRFQVYKSPNFPRNKILVGYKGGSYLETGYVYAPYVPLIVTPTLYAAEDFTPRKGVMTRYGKKMVRADFYGVVTCMDMNII